MRMFRFVVNFRLWHPALSVEAISAELANILKPKIPVRVEAAIRRFIELLESKASFFEYLDAKGGRSGGAFRFTERLGKLRVALAKSRTI